MCQLFLRIIGTYGIKMSNLQLARGKYAPKKKNESSNKSDLELARGVYAPSDRNLVRDEEVKSLINNTTNLSKNISNINSTLIKSAGDIEAVKTITGNKQEINDYLSRAKDLRAQYGDDDAYAKSLDTTIKYLSNIRGVLENNTKGGSLLTNSMLSETENRTGNAANIQKNTLMSAGNAYLAGRDMETQTAKSMYDMYYNNLMESKYGNKKISELTDTLKRNKDSVTDDNRLEKTRENKWLKSYIESKATEDDYAQIMEESKNNIDNKVKERNDIGATLLPYDSRNYADKTGLGKSDYDTYNKKITLNREIEEQQDRYAKARTQYLDKVIDRIGTDAQNVRNAYNKNVIFTDEAKEAQINHLVEKEGLSRESAEQEVENSIKTSDRYKQLDDVQINSLVSNIEEKYALNHETAADVVYRIMEQENQEKSDAIYEKAYSEGGSNIVKSAKSVLNNLVGSIPQATDILLQSAGNIFRDNKIPVDSTRIYPAAQKTQGLRDSVSSDIDSNAGKFLYSTGMSLADYGAILATSMATMGLGAAAGVGETTLQASMEAASPLVLTQFGASSGSSTYVEAKKNGASDNEALALGTIAGAAEVVFENISLDKLIDGVNPDKAYKIAYNALIQGGIEGTEEVNTELANIIAEQIVLGDKSEYSRLYNELLKNGYTEKDANKEVAKNAGMRVAQSFLGGALSGGVMGLGAGTIGYASNSNYRKMARYGQSAIDNNSVSDLQNFIKNNYDTDSDIYKLMENTNVEDSAAVGYLLTSAMSSEFQKGDLANREAYIPAIEQRLAELGVEEGNREIIAGEVWNKVNGSRKTGAISRIGRQNIDVINQVSEELQNKSETRQKWVNDIDRNISSRHYGNAKILAKMTQKESFDNKTDNSVKESIKTDMDAKTEDGYVTSGRAHLINDADNKFNITTLVVNKDGKTVAAVRTDEGKHTQYDMDDVVADRDIVELYLYGNEYQPEQRKVFFRAYDEGGRMGSVDNFAYAYNNVYNYGMKNLGIQSALQDENIGFHLTDKQIELAYEAGKQMYMEKINKKASEIKKVKNSKNGVVIFDKVNEKNLNKIQKAAVDVAGVLSRITNANYEFFASTTDENGRYVGENGSYNPDTNTIRIDINAGMLSENEGNNIMIVTLAHELTHYIEEFSHSEYAKLQEFAFNKLAEKTGMDINEIINREKEKIRKDRKSKGLSELSRTKLEERAKSEITARSFETMLADENSIRELAKKDKGLFVKLRDKILDFVKKIETACREILNRDGNFKEGTISQEARLLQEYAKEMRELWSTALEDAGENVKTMPGKQNKEVLFNERAYRNTKNKELDDFVKRSINNPNIRESFEISEKISRRLAYDIKKITGIDVSDYSNEIDSDTIVHINNRHGSKGNADQLFSDISEIQHIEYLIENYTDIKKGEFSKKYKNRDGSKAQNVELSIKVDNDMYYVVEAVPDTKRKKLKIVTEYKNKATMKVPNKSKKSSAYVQNELSSATFTGSISDNSENSNEKFQKNIFENVETTGIKLQDRNSYPYNEQTVIQDYLDSVDDKIKSDYEKVVAGDNKFKRNYISDVTSRQIQDFKNIAGIDITGYTNNINTNAYKHICERHGVDGTHDNTMAKSDDVARMKYVIENYDNAELVKKSDSTELDYSGEFRDSSDNPAKMIKFSKKINGTQYVVITAADNKYKKLWVVSTYIKKRVTQALDVQAPRSDVRNALASPLGDSISNNSENSNEKFQMSQSLEDFSENIRNTNKNSSNERFSIREFKDGKQYVHVDTEQHLFEGKERSEFPSIAKKIITRRFQGKVVGKEGKNMFVHAKGKGEYINSRKPIKEEYIFDSKMKAAGELDNMLEISEFLGNQPDGKDGHYHKNNIGGFDYYKILFEVEHNFFEGIINVEITKNGRQFKDITKIKDVTEGNLALVGKNQTANASETSFDKSISNNSENSNEKFQIRYDENNTPFVEIEEDILDGISKNEWSKKVKEVLKTKFATGIQVGNNSIFMNTKGRKEYLRSKYSQRIYGTKLYVDKLRMSNNADEIVIASRNYVNEKNKHNRKDNIEDFARGKVYIRVGKSDYRAEVVIANENNRLYLYDIVNIDRIKIKERSNHYTGFANSNSSRWGASSNDSISNNSENSNEKFQMRQTQEEAENGTDKYQSRDYSYNELINKPDMIVTRARRDYKHLTISKCIEVILSDLKKEENTIVYNGNIAVKNNDTGDYILVTKGALKHGLVNDRTGTTKLVSANIAEAIKNGIKVNVAAGERNNADSAYVIMGKLESNNKLSGGTYYYRMVVNRYEGNNQGVFYIDGLYSIKAQKRETSAARIATGVTANADGFPDLRKLKVSEFLNEVKDYYGDSLSEDVNNHLGRVRGKSDIEGLRYQNRNSDSLDVYEDVFKVGDGTDKYQSGNYSYNELIMKPDMKVPVLSNVQLSEYNSRADILNEAMNNLKKDKEVIVDGEIATIHNEDTDRDIEVSKRRLRHGIARRVNEASVFVTLNIGDAIKYGINVNEAIGERNNADSAFVLMGKLSNKQGQDYYYRLVVNTFNEGEYEVNRLYAAKAKKKVLGGNAPTPAVKNTAKLNTFFELKVSDFLNEVKDYYGDSLSEDVMNHFGRTRGKSDIEGLRYQNRNSESLEAYREILNNSEKYKNDNSLKSTEELESLAKNIEQRSEIRFDRFYSVGKLPKIYQDLLGIEERNLVLIPTHAYANMVAEEQAENDNVYNKAINYHKLGHKKWVKLLEKLADPMAIYDNNRETSKPRLAIQLTDKWSAVIELYSNVITADRSSRKNHSTITIFPLEANDYYTDFNCLYRKSSLKTEVPKAISPGVMNSLNSYAENITQFKDKINDYLDNRVMRQNRDSSLKLYEGALTDSVDYVQAVEYQNQILESVGIKKVSDRGIDRLTNKLIKETKTILSKDEIKASVKAVFERAADEQMSRGEMIDELKSITYRALNEKKSDLKRTDYAQGILDELRNTRIRLTEDQAMAVYRTTGLKFEDWRRSLFGKVFVTNNGTGVALDTKWKELSRLYPETFEENVSIEDMPAELETAVFNLSNDYVNDWGFDFEDSALYSATEVLAEYGRLPEVKNKTDMNSLEAKQEEYDKQLGKVRVEYLNRIKEFRKGQIQDLRNAKKQWLKERRDREQQLKIRYENLMNQRVANIKNREDSVWTTRDKEKLRNGIIRTVKRLNTMVVKPTNQKHAPQGFLKKTAEFCQLFMNDTSVFSNSALDDLKVAYAALNTKITDENGNEVNYVLQGQYDVDVEHMMDTLRDTIAGKRLSQLTVSELKTVRDIVEHFDTIIKNENEIEINGRKQSIESVSHKMLSELEEKGQYGEYLEHGEGIKEALYNNLTPVYFFKRLGSTSEKLFNDVLRGQDKAGKNIYKAKIFMMETKDKYHYDKWNHKATVEIGDGIELNAEQALYIYATNNREKQNIRQKAHHLTQGGIVLEDKVKWKDKKHLNIDKKITQQRSYHVNASDMVKIGSFLTNEQKAYADTVVDYLSNNMAELGNETSMQLYGLKKYDESYYFPYKTVDSYIEHSATAHQDVESSLLSKSFSKNLTDEAVSPIVVGEFTRAAGQHINEMITYNALAIAQDNMNKVFNYVEVFRDEETGRKTGVGASVKQMLAGTHGDKAVNYFKNFIIALNGGVKADPMENIYSKMLSRFKKAKTYMSASVVVQQPSSLCRAFAIINPKYFDGIKISSKYWEECKKYNGVAVIKEMGGYDTGLGAGTTEYIVGKRAGNLFEAIEEKVDDSKLAQLPGKMDEIAWCTIWNAVKNETKDLGGYKGNEPEFFEKASMRFDEIINKTQVYDSVMSKSSHMRSKSTMAKMVTAFMAEPTVSYNMLVDGLRGGTGKKYGARVLGSLTLNVVTNALLYALVAAARNDRDEDKSYMEKYAKAFTSKAIGEKPTFSGEWNPLTWIPFVRDITNLLDGYDVERTDISLISDMLDSLGDLSVLSQELIKSVRNEDYQVDYSVVQDGLLGFASSVSAFTGIPVTNVIRDVKAAMNLGRDFVNDNLIPAEKGKTFSNIWDSLMEGMGFEITDTDKINDYLDGKNAVLDELIQDAKEEVYRKHPDYPEEKIKKEAGANIRTKLTRVLKDNYFAGDISKEDTIKQMKKSGLYMDDKGNDDSNVTFTMWEIAELKKQYLNVAYGTKNFDERRKIRKKLFDTGHWKSLEELDKQLKKWIE